jgi:hypothetical protein
MPIQYKVTATEVVPELLVSVTGFGSPRGLETRILKFLEEGLYVQYRYNDTRDNVYKVIIDSLFTQKTEETVINIEVHSSVLLKLWQSGSAADTEDIARSIAAIKEVRQDSSKENVLTKRGYVKLSGRGLSDRYSVLFMLLYTYDAYTHKMVPHIWGLGLLPEAVMCLIDEAAESIGLSWADIALGT